MGTFFEQPLGYGLSDIDYDTMSVSVCYNGGGMFPVSIMKCADENVVAYWRNIARKYIRLNENMRTYVEDKYTELLDGKRVLGVSVREGYQNWRKYNRMEYGGILYRRLLNN